MKTSFIKRYLLPVIFACLGLGLLIPTLFSEAKQYPWESEGDDSHSLRYLPLIMKLGDTPSPQATQFPSSTPWPTVTETPSVTPSPTNTSPAPQTPTPTSTSSPTATAVSHCPVQFQAIPLADTNYVFVTGEVGTTVTITDLTTGLQIGESILIKQNGHLCPGFTNFSDSPLSENLVVGHVLIVESNDGTVDTAIVISQSPTETPTATNTATPSATPTPTGTATNRISGIVQKMANGWNPQSEVVVQLIDPNGGVLVTIETDNNGAYSFNNIPPLSDPDRYQIEACYTSAVGTYFGRRYSIQPPFTDANIYLLSGACS